MKGKDKTIWKRRGPRIGVQRRDNWEKREGELGKKNEREFGKKKKNNIGEKGRRIGKRKEKNNREKKEREFGKKTKRDFGKMRIWENNWENGEEDIYI